MKGRAEHSCALVAVCALVLASAACGPDARRLAADDTVRLTRAALIEVGGSAGGEATVSGDDATTEPLARSRDWLEQAEQGIEVWGSSGSLAYDTAAPCLGRALGDLRDALVATGRDVPTVLEEAEASALAATDRRCAERRGH